MADDVIAGLVAQLSMTVDQGNNESVSELAEDLVASIGDADELSAVDQMLELMQRMRDKRYFLELRDIGDALIQAGEGHLRVRRFYAQSLIDSGEMTAAKYVLSELVNGLEQQHPEYLQAKGLVGRLHKQLFADHRNSQSKIALGNLSKASEIYRELYEMNPAQHLWHGINAVALNARAVREQLEIGGAETYKEMAADIISAITGREEITPWDGPIMAEALIALGDGETALIWCDKLADDDSISAFHVASLVRQLREIWQLNAESGLGSYILPKLQHAMLHKEGGLLDVDSLNAVPAQAKNVLQKTLGATGVMEAEWIERLTRNAKSVARIGKNSSKGLGTGFAVRGEDINPDWKGKSLLLTNFHVISPTGQTSGLHWRNAIVSFYGSKEIYRIANILWYSEPSPSFMGCPNMDYLDVVIAELDRSPEIDSFYSVGSYLPVVEAGEPQRVYLIGHPNGGGLSYSMQDNRLLDHEVPLIHYHAPTEPGSSGSPVFNEELELVGIHHAGSFAAPLLNGKKNPATRDKYPANEGIWIQSVIDRVNRG